MKVNITLDVTAFERYVIAQYYGPASDKPRARRRANRAQIKRFIKAAVTTSALDRADDLPKRKRSAAFRLRKRLLEQQEQSVEQPEQLSERERQRELALEN